MILSIWFDIFLFFILTVSYLQINNTLHDNKYYILYFSSGILIFLSGFRYYYGADYQPYIEIFKDSKRYYITYSSILNGDIEPGYLFLNKIINENNLPFYYVTFAMALMSISLKTYVFKEYSPYPLASLLLFFSPVYFFEDVGQIRQGLTVGICAFSVKFIIEKKLIYFLITVFIAYQFHSTAMVFLLAYIVGNLNLNSKHWLILIIISIILSPLKAYEILGPIVQKLGSESASYRFSGYSNDEQYGAAIEFGIGDITRIILIIIVLSYDNFAVAKFKHYKYFRNLLLFNNFLYYIFRTNTIFASRLPGAFGMYNMLVIPYIIASVPLKSLNIIKTYLFLFTFLIYFRFSNVNAKNYFNYKNVFFESHIDFDNPPKDYVIDEK